MQLDYKPLTALSLQQKTVLLRIDGNVPISNNQILDDFKLKEVKPTIEYILKEKACLIILTHLGNPKQPSADFSTHILIPWFLNISTHVTFIDNLEILQSTPKIPGHILLFENVRFFKEEKDK